MGPQNTKGFTLVEIAVGLAVIGFLVLTMGQIQTVFVSQNTLASQRMDYENMRIDVRSVIYSRNQCKHAFRQGNLDLKYNGNPISISSVNMVRQASPTNPAVDKPVLTVGYMSPSGIRVDSIDIKPLPGSPAPIPGGPNIYRVEMVINTTATKGPRKGEQRGNSQSSSSGRFKFYLATDQNDDITECAWRGEQLSKAKRGCDRSGYDPASARAPNPNSGLPPTMRIYNYGYLPDYAIDDGGNSGTDDDALFYCTTNGSGAFGSIALCLSKEYCPWK